MSKASQREVSAIREAAVDWVVQLNSEGVTAEEKTEFTAWLRRSPAHVKEYLQAEAAWQAMEGAAAQDEVSIHELTRGLARGVANLPGLASVASGSQRRIGIWGFSAAAAVFLTVLVIALMLSRSGEYSTRLGEIRSVKLPDGSTMELNTQSRAQVAMSADAREVVLEKGEAFFAVAKDSTRPFRVKSGDVWVRALGTQFNVYRQLSTTRVTVVEGRVAVERAGSRPVELGAGEMMDLSPQRPVEHVATVVTKNAVAWRRHRLVFENDTLANVIGAFNRYNALQLAIQSPDLNAKRISGVFKPDRPEALVDFLTQTGDVRVTQRSDERIVLDAEVGGHISDSTRLD